MKRTISIKLITAKDQVSQLELLRDSFLAACNAIVPFAIEHRCWNRVALHNFAYSKIRASSPLGSQMVCNAIFAVCKAYRAKAVSKDEPVPVIQFRKTRSVHFDKRTYSIKGNILSLYHINHSVSKQIIQEAVNTRAGIIVMENLTHIRKRIKTGKKVRSRLHRWAFYQLQTMIHIKHKTTVFKSSMLIQPTPAKPAHFVVKQESAIATCLDVFVETNSTVT